jgi:transposase
MRSGINSNGSDLILKKTLHAAEQERPDVRAARAHWRAEQGHWEGARLVFLDETGLNTKLGRLYGRAAGGKRCVGALPHGHWRTSTLVVGLRCEGLIAPLLIDGPMDGAMFLAYIRHVLALELKSGDRVICDNLASHRVDGVEQAITERGATLHYLPPYSPDLNPIELAFSKLKAELRRRAARSLPSLIRAAAAAMKSFTPEHCRHFFRHAKYATN